MSKEELALQIKHMETQMNLLRQAHDEERKELNNTISTLEANVKEQRDVESRLTHLELSLSQSWENKDILRGTSNRYISGESDNMTEGAEHEMTMVNVGGREQAITLTFGDIDTKPTTLERFISSSSLPSLSLLPSLYLSFSPSLGDKEAAHLPEVLVLHSVYSDTKQ